MGKLYDSLLSGSSGRTGKIVVANVYGNEITRVRPKKRTGAPSAKQLLIQKRMKDCADFMQSYRTYASAYFGKRIGMKSSYNLAMTNLMNNFVIDYAANTITQNYPDMLFSKGNLLTPVSVGLNLNGPQTLVVNWQDNSAGNLLRQTDKAQILIAKENTTNTLFVENAADRLDSTYSVNLPPQFQGHSLHVYLAFKAEDDINVSNSLYMGSVV